LFGFWPRFLCFGLSLAVCFAVSAGETQVWLGDLRVVVLVCFSFCCFVDLLILRTFLSLYRVLSACSHVRTELQCDIGQTRGKKNPLSDSKSGVPGYPRDGVLALSRESAEVNRKRASSGPIKVVVTNQPHSRRHTGVDLVSGTTALLAWFPASWASKIAPCFVGESDGSTQAPQEISFSCPHRYISIAIHGLLFPRRSPWIAIDIKHLRS